MRCAVSFLGVIFLVLGVSVAAFFIIWAIDEETECPATSFVCEENGKCIANRYFCDKIPHCPNGSDETALKCKDLTTTYDFLFRHGKGCYEPKAAQNTTVALKPPEECYIDNRTLNCNGPKWKKIPWDRFDRDMTTLVLNESIETDELRLDEAPKTDNQFMKIYFENNVIRSLANNSLCNIAKICWLHLENNSIEKINDGAWCTMEKLEILNLSRNKLRLDNFQFKDMNNLNELWLQHNEITNITEKMFSQLPNLIALNLQHNKVEVIHRNSFISNTLLIEVDLSYNRIKIFPPYVFARQTNLTQLIIANNPIESLQKEVFANLQSLISLYLTGIEQEAIDIKSFELMRKLDVVHFDRFQYCRYVPNATRCFPNTDGLSSTEDLLIGKTLRMVVWIVALLTLIGNIMVIASRWYNRRGKILDVFVNNLAGADFLMGIYLLVLAIKDAQFRYVYNIHAYNWTTSLVCSAIGILAMISSEVSLLILTLMSLERYLVISGPFSHRQRLTVWPARVSMAIIWIFVIVLALAPALQWQGNSSFYGSTGLCFPLHLDDAYSMGWQYTAFVFIGVNSVCLMLITFSYGKLFYIIRQTRMNTPTPVEVSKDLEMAFRFFLMVVTDLLCWTPIIILKIVVMYGHQIPKEVITWVLILILPFSSLVNPFLYTFSTREVRMKLKKLISCASAMGINGGNGLDMRLNANIGTTATENSRSNIPVSNGATN